MGRQDLVVPLLVEVWRFICRDDDRVYPFDPTSTKVSWYNKSERPSVFGRKGLIVHLKPCEPGIAEGK